MGDIATVRLQASFQSFDQIWCARPDLVFQARLPDCVPQREAAGRILQIDLKAPLSDPA